MWRAKEDGDMRRVVVWVVIALGVYAGSYLAVSRYSLDLNRRDGVTEGFYPVPCRAAVLMESRGLAAMMGVMYGVYLPAQVVDRWLGGPTMMSELPLKGVSRADVSSRRYAVVSVGASAGGAVASAAGDLVISPRTIVA